MFAAPCNQTGHIGVSDLIEPLVLAEERYEPFDVAKGRVGAGVMLPDFAPVTAGRNVDSEWSALPCLGLF